MADPRLLAHTPHITEKFLDECACGVANIGFPQRTRGVLCLTFSDVEKANAFVATANDIPAIKEKLLVRQPPLLSEKEALMAGLEMLGGRTPKPVQQSSMVAIASKSGKLTPEMVKDVLGMELGPRQHGSYLI